MPLEAASLLEYPAPMRNVEDIEAEIEKLAPDELERLAEWLAEYRAQAWDKQMAKDSELGGPLRRFIDEAKSDLKAGRTRPLP
jgi:hypothetical protein